MLCSVLLSGAQGCFVGPKDQPHEEQDSPRALSLLSACQHCCSGGFAAQFGSGHWNPILCFHCCVQSWHSLGFPVLLFGLCWSQCSVPDLGVPGAPCLACVGPSAASPPQDSLYPLLPGCSSLPRTTEEPPAAAGLRARAGPSSRSHPPPPPPPPCLLCTEPAPQSRGRTFTLGCHQGWVTRREGRGLCLLCLGAAGPWVWASPCLGHSGQPFPKGSLSLGCLPWPAGARGLIPGVCPSWRG